jgi:hypothetical protein
LNNLVLPNLATLDLIAIAFILLTLCFWLVSIISEARLKKTLKKTTDLSLYESQFRCVVFSAGDNACRNALEYHTKPILLSNAPNLPLRGCGAENCSCNLLQHEDRRMGEDRRDTEALDKERKSVYANKRLLRDRRRASIQEFLLPQYRTFN